jgi:hypothetical protein
LEDVRRDAELAARAVELVDEAIGLARRLTSGREAGERLFKRLEVSGATLASVGEPIAG